MKQQQEQQERAVAELRRRTQAQAQAQAQAKAKAQAQAVRQSTRPAPLTIAASHQSTVDKKLKRALASPLPPTHYERDPQQWGTTAVRVAPQHQAQQPMKSSTSQSLNFQNLKRHPDLLSRTGFPTYMLVATRLRYLRSLSRRKAASSDERRHPASPTTRLRGFES
jgi:hypothetical protein